MLSHHHGQPQLPQLQGEIEERPGSGGVDDVEQQIRLLALDEAAGDLLVQARLLVGQGMMPGRSTQGVVVPWAVKGPIFLSTVTPLQLPTLLAGAGQALNREVLPLLGLPTVTRL